MTAQWRVLRNANTDEVILPRIRLCISFWCHFKGLQFVRNLPPDEGLLFVRNSESVAETTIHMFFMFIPISVLWLDASGKVIDKKLAKPWRPAYVPGQPAQYFLEANTEIFNRVEIGDVLSFDEVVS